MRKGAALGLALAAAFLGLSAVNLGAQGAYYDELHQAPAAFAWIGRPAPFFAFQTLFGLPVLNMPYSGAIKSAVYGLVLALSGGTFSIEGWRLLGLSFVAAGLVSFCILATRLPLLARGVFGVLVVTDLTVLLASRHDWGPVALALALRLVFLGVWLREPTPAATAWLGFLVTLSVFEKLSNVVLAVPLALIVATEPARRTRRATLALAAGLLAGALPVLFVNVQSWRHQRTLVSLHSVAPKPLSLRGLGTHLDAIATLGAGREARAYVLGEDVPPLRSTIERAALLAGLAAAAAAVFASRRSPLAAPAAVALASGPLVAVAIYLLPSPTWIHHGIVTTPFPYLALVVGLAASESVPWARRGLLVVVAVFLATRLPNLLEVESALVRGASSRRFDPSLNALGRLAAREGPESFIATDWGVATQIFCFGDGRGRAEPIWAYGGVDQLRSLVAGRTSFTLVKLRPAANVRPEVTARIEEDARTLPGFHEVAAAGGVTGLTAVEVRRFERDEARP